MTIEIAEFEENIFVRVDLRINVVVTDTRKNIEIVVATQFSKISQDFYSLVSLVSCSINFPSKNYNFL